MSVWVGKDVFWKMAPIGAGKGLIKATAAPTVAETRAVKLRVIPQNKPFCRGDAFFKPDMTELTTATVFSEFWLYSCFSNRPETLAID